LMAWGAVAHATIIASAPPLGGPAVNAGANGSTVVNINAAGKGGVSHNIYTQFDVDRGGVVLNNSAANSTTQLSGVIAGNANMAGGSASIILNEVNSTKASQLNGMMEVAGQKAQVIVANPSGITCSGCGFINTERATLTTGKPQVANGSLLGYTVEKGTIVVNGNGLNAADTTYTDVIARAVQINADIRAKDL
uniref:Filamentous haemagglutinin FhaB/tRNA nuclease CdiA-like TPS domain-containing protein n=2 Tax=cellular organisms TaxID=131567 RepID=A0A8W7PY47_ANOCL